MNVTVVTEQIRQMFSYNLQDLESAVTDTKPGADGILFLPYLTGERTPNLPQGKGLVHGLNCNNMEPAKLARAAMEGATMGLAYGLNKFREMGINPSEIRITGGGSKSPAWRQIAADIFSASVVPLSTSEGASLGAAIQVINCYESSDANSYEELCNKFVELDEQNRCEPIKENISLYKGLLEEHTKLTSDLNRLGYI